MWYAHDPTLYRCAEGDNSEVRGLTHHLCGMSGGRPKTRFGAQEVVVGTEDVLRRRLIHLGLATGPLCSPLELNGHMGTHFRGVVGALGPSVMWYLLYL